MNLTRYTLSQALDLLKINPNITFRLNDGNTLMRLVDGNFVFDDCFTKCVQLNSFVLNGKYTIVNSKA